LAKRIPWSRAYIHSGSATGK